MARLEFLQAEYIAHEGAANSTWDGFSDIWKTITDYWRLHKSRKNIDTAWKAAQRMVDSVYGYSKAIDGVWAADRVALTMQKAQVPPVQLFFGTEEYFTNAAGTSTRSEAYDEIPEGAILCLPTGVSDQYYLPTWVRYLASLSDFVLEPTLQLSSNDFTISTSVLDNKTGTITFDPGSDYKDVMWCSYFLQKSISDIIHPWGDAVGYTCRKEGRLEDWAYRDMRALAYALMNGPTAYNLELGISVFNLWPYTPFKCQVTTITGATSITLRNIEDNQEITITNSSGLPFRQRTESGWVDISETDILEANRAITESCHIETWNSDQSLLESLGLTRASGRHVVAAVFDANLPLAAAWNGWISLASSSISATPPIPSLAGYAVDQQRTLDHIERARNSGTSFFYIALLDVQLNILEVLTTYGLPMLPVDGEVLTSYTSLFPPETEIISTFAEALNAPNGDLDTTYDMLTEPGNLDIDTSYAITLNAPAASLSATSY